jgi:two-component system, response regulator RpfG
MPSDLIDQDFQGATVVIIDDEFTSRTILSKTALRICSNIVVEAFDAPLVALDWLATNQPDLILLDYVMNGLNGHDVLCLIRDIDHLKDIPVIVITSATEKNVRYQMLEDGATDFVLKPIDPYECHVRCRNLLLLRLHQKMIHQRAQSLEEAVKEATQKILDREHETIFRLAKAGEYRDTETGNHILRMSKYSRLIAEGLGLDRERCDLIEMASPMHDIGKIGIPDNILLKPGRLSVEEFEIMKTHTTIGFGILKDSPSKFIRLGAEIALGHHEKFDGSGYPNQLKAKEIPLESRIVAVADAYDALTSDRPYKSAWSTEDSLEYLVANKGKLYDPDCVDIFIKQSSKAFLIQHQLKDFDTDNVAEPKAVKK